MYKNLEILGKEKFKDTKYNSVEVSEIGKNLGLIPVGFLEVTDMSAIAPVLIMGPEDDMEFIGLFGLSSEMTIFNKQDLLQPLYVRSYPFLSVKAKTPEDELSNVIGIDNNEEYVGEDKATAIFGEDGELASEASRKIEMVRELNRQRDVSKVIVKALQENDLLVQKDFKVKAGDEEKTVLENFYVVDREKLYKLDEKVLLEWAQKGWLTLIDCHIRSLRNFTNIVIG